MGNDRAPSLARVAQSITGWLRDYLHRSEADGFAFGLSGGVDSALAAGLASMAIGPDSTLGALLPCESESLDAELGQLVADTFGIPTISVDLTSAYEALIGALPPCETALAAANLKPRLRMTALYYLATARNYLVLGSGNRTEIAVGYFTKYGDGGVDLLPLGGLSKTTVWRLAAEIGVPQAVIDRPPTAGLWPGQTDEAEMGIAYRELDRVLSAIAAGEVDEVDRDVLAKVQRMSARSAHKRALPPVCDLELVD